MKRASLASVLALALFATGCATTPEPAVATRASPASPGAQIDQDHAYMRQVEQIALRRGIGVTWVNPPTKRRAPPSR